MTQDRTEGQHVGVAIGRQAERRGEREVGGARGETRPGRLVGIISRNGENSKGNK